MKVLPRALALLVLCALPLWFLLFVDHNGVLTVAVLVIEVVVLVGLAVALRPPSRPSGPGADRPSPR